MEKITLKLNALFPIFSCFLWSKHMHGALAGVGQWIERQLANQRVTGSIPSQGTCLGWGPGQVRSPVGGM